MRISTQMLYDQNMRGISDAQSLWLSYGEQMSTGNRVNRPSDDPIAASQAVVLSQAQSMNDQYKLARTFATQKVSLEESVLQQTVSSIQSAQEKVVYAASSGTLSDDDRASLATDLEGIRNQILNLANSTDGNGRYIFAGYKTEAAPFTGGAGSITYQGGTIPITQQVDTARTMTIGHTGNDVFNRISSNATPEPDGSPSETNIFNMLDSAIAALKTPTAGLDDAGKKALDAAVAKTNRGLSNALSNVSTVRAELGTQLNELSKLDDLGSERALAQTDQMSQLVGADYTATVSNYVQQQAALQASYKVFTDLQGMSLFQLNSR
ncbi:flagellar hook-associated protein FlgL [Cedecea neteri]|uniref:Flagellar hook protein FlgL n=1 Tax=Cedecea neteri TaxID=158822 RepID=A0AAN0VTZ0_9ENTR|nr:MULTISPECIES: flagellar hook-associated protein FlgL [Cedecea]AIR61659.1 flagellar hook protein FlgL [Cedecea neteri]NIG74148.1 flagellar hook-filament junction protein FlgL [Klebsiella sp. Ap-873]WNJ77970.1 flagellar hook-associated protein FlgL [Cedecea neteri]SMG53005.1 flagellar hook-associated protein 3 FlgL [Cedecea sp. NFIX57]